MSKAIATARLDIVTFEQAADYIRALNAAGLLYHFDDDADDCLFGHGLTAEQLQNIEHNVNQLFAIDWKANGYACPFDFVLKHCEV